MPGDEPATLRVLLLHRALLGNLVIMVLCMIGPIIDHRLPIGISWLSAALAGVSLLLLPQVRQGRVGATGAVLLGTVFIAITAAIALLGTIRGPIAGFYLGLIVAAGFLFDQRGTILSVVLSSLAVGGLIIAENAGILPAPNYAVSATQWATSTLLFASMA